MTNPRLHGIVIDVPSADQARAVEFWAAALGCEPEVSASYPEYAQFEAAAPGCYVLVQATGNDTARIHLDFATDDRDGEIDRLVRAGASELTREHKWAVMADPAGHPFCLCPVTGC
ncbi:MAG TPA: VOC family protein [Mycobacteriales bacterium]|nr:VOC family protein [Mycobacteriales bacterium]